MRYFITGATGFIGGRVARQLAEEGLRETLEYEMRALGIRAWD